MIWVGEVGMSKMLQAAAQLASKRATRAASAMAAGPQHLGDIPPAEYFNFIGPKGKYQVGGSYIGNNIIVVALTKPVT